MTREEQIKQVGNAYAIDEVKGTCNPRGLFYSAFVDGAEWADAHPNWISVEDELPEVGAAVLTTTQNGTQRVGCYEDGWWLANSPNLVRMGSITHWMPLPQPPEHIADVSKKIGSSELPNNHTKAIKKGGEQ